MSGSAWIDRAGELAEWAWRFTNRFDVWGGYWPLDQRDTLGKATTRPAVRNRGKVYLTKDVFARHFRATAPEHVVGLHTTSPANTSLWGAVEVDQHGDGGNTPEANLNASLAWYAELVRRGFQPLLTDSNGKGGYHLRFLLAEPAPTPRVFAFLKALTADHARHGITAQPETFPKQPRVTDSGAGSLGNWLRLPGRHHTREHWSKVWDGSAWLDGAEAVAYLLTFQGDPIELVPPEPPPLHKRRVLYHRNHGRGGLSARIAGYLARLPNLGEGQGRDDVAYGFACFLVRDMAVSDAVALEWLQLWDAGNSPPKGAERLAEIIADAHQYGRQPYGGRREDDTPAPGKVVVIPGRRPGHLILRCQGEGVLR